MHPKWLEYSDPYHVECIQPPEEHNLTLFRKNLDRLQQNPIFIDYFVLLWYEPNRRELEVLYKIIEDKLPVMKEHGLRGKYPAVDLGELAYNNRNMDLLKFIATRCLSLEDLLQLYIRIDSDGKNALIPLLSNNQTMYIAANMDSISQVAQILPNYTELSVNLLHAIRKTENTSLGMEICSEIFTSAINMNGGMIADKKPTISNFSICGEILLACEKLHANHVELVAFLTTEINYLKLIQLFSNTPDKVLLKVFDSLHALDKKYLVLDVLIEFIKINDRFKPSHALKISQLFSAPDILSNKPAFVHFLLQIKASSEQKQKIFARMADFFTPCKGELLRTFADGKKMFGNDETTHELAEDFKVSVAQLKTLQQPCIAHNVPFLECVTCVERRLDDMKKSLNSKNFLSEIIKMFSVLRLSEKNMRILYSKYADTVGLYDAMIDSHSFQNVFVILLHYAHQDTNPIQPRLKAILNGDDEAYCTNIFMYNLWGQIANNMNFFKTTKVFKIDFSMAISKFGESVSLEALKEFVENSDPYFKSPEFIMSSLADGKTFLASRMLFYLNDDRRCAEAISKIFPQHLDVMAGFLKDCDVVFKRNLLFRIAHYKNKKLLRFLFDAILNEQAKDMLVNCLRTSLIVEGNFYFFELIGNAAFVRSEILMDKTNFLLVLRKCNQIGLQVPINIFPPSDLLTREEFYLKFKDIIDTCLSNYQMSQEFFIEFFIEANQLKSVLQQKFDSLLLDDKLLCSEFNTADFLQRYNVDFLWDPQVQLIWGAFTSATVQYPILRQLVGVHRPLQTIFSDWQFKSPILQLEAARISKQEDLLPEFGKIQGNTVYFLDPTTDPKEILGLIIKQGKPNQIMQYFKKFMDCNRVGLPFDEAIEVLSNRLDSIKDNDQRNTIVKLLINASNITQNYDGIAGFLVDAMGVLNWSRIEKSDFINLYERIFTNPQMQDKSIMAKGITKLISTFYNYLPSHQLLNKLFAVFPEWSKNSEIAAAINYNFKLPALRDMMIDIDTSAITEASKLLIPSMVSHALSWVGSTPSLVALAEERNRPELVI